MRSVITGITTQAGIATALNTAGVTSTNAWYVVPRMATQTTETYAYEALGCSATQSIWEVLNTGNYSSHFLVDACSSGSKLLYGQTKEIVTTHTYLYDLYIFTP